MKKLSNKRWEEMKANSKKAEKMIDDLIAELKTLDCTDGWEEMILTSILLDKNTERENIIDALEIKFSMRVLSVDSMVQEMRIDEFIEELKQNPYQLKPIA